MKKLDIFYHCNHECPRSCTTFTANVGNVDEIEWPIEKLKGPVQVDVVKKEVEGDRVLSAEVTTYMIGNIAEASEVIISPFGYLEAIQQPLIERNLPASQEKYLSVEYKPYRIPHPLRFYKRCPNKEMVVYQTPSGQKQICPKTDDIKVYKNLSAMAIGFLGDVIDYFAEAEKEESTAKTYTKNDKFKGNFHVFFE